MIIPHYPNGVAFHSPESRLSRALWVCGTVVLGLLGPVLDKGRGKDRWQRWRPTVALARQEDLLVARLDLMVPRRWRTLDDQVAEDVRSVSPEERAERIRIRQEHVQRRYRVF